ncbi:uncharacterized protein LOC8082343 [Sorghum bicolor]|nr:uncharacterized protein LOC8082343 [Sorghum bicolor]KXG39430.1 hypothetical protein SORBI_3001G381700 [Sorghum bicolor]OQU92646.1 hypothetical protein SORBI_3001G381700 [Sorghum bicolor]|eukprot:XP_002465312.2 uncharacterized protein LOC8082343 [Sorghum bicolor]
MQPVCRLRLAPARPEVPRARAGTATTCLQVRRATTTSRGCAWCVCVAPARRPRTARTSCGAGPTEPVEARKDGAAPAVDLQADQEAGLLAPEELEVLEEAAITGDDEGRRPTDYDRRAHIFEESSRVFRELKQRSDGDGGSGGSESGPGGATTGASATAAEKRACNEQQQ